MGRHDSNQAKKYLEDLKRKLKKAIARVESSYKRLPALPAAIDDLSDEQLGAYEEFVSRFGRLADMFLMKYLRVRVLEEDPAFAGSFRDTLDYAEKHRWIDDAQKWFDIRELRNKQAHEYDEEDLIGIFKKTVESYDRLKTIENTLDATP